MELRLSARFISLPAGLAAARGLGTDDDDAVRLMLVYMTPTLNRILVAEFVLTLLLLASS